MMKRIRRLRTWMLQVPVSVKIFGIGAGLVALLSAQMIWHVRNTCRLTMEGQVKQQARALLADAIALAPDSFAAPQAARVQALLAGLLEHHPEIISLSLLNGQNKTVARASAAQPLTQAWLGRVTTPLPNAGSGSLQADVSRNMIQAHVDLLTRQMLLIALLLALLGVGMAWALTQIIVRPLRELMHAAAEVRSGNLKVRARRHSGDELGLLTDAFNEMTKALEQKEAIRTHLIQRVISAQEEERMRVSQELHDELGQSMTSIALGLKNLEAKTSDGCAALCRELRELAVRTMEAAHDLAMQLRPSVLRDLGLMAALEHHANLCKKRFGIQVSLTVIGLDGLQRLPEPIEVALYRIVQEALTNSVKHGRTKSVSIILQRRLDSILVTIEDEGYGFDSTHWRLRCLERKRLGLLGMEERVKSLNGGFTIESDPARGTTIYVELPLEMPALVSA